MTPLAGKSTRQLARSGPRGWLVAIFLLGAIGSAVVVESGATIVGPGELRIIAVGIDDYGSVRLRGAQQDARAVTAVFEEIGARHFGTVSSRLLLGEQAAQAPLVETLEQAVFDLSPEDTLVFFFSGIGGIPPLDQGSYLLATPDHPATQAIWTAGRYTGPGLPISRLVALLEQLRARRIVVVIDADFSGDAMREFESAVFAKDRIASEVEMRGTRRSIAFFGHDSHAFEVSTGDVVQGMLSAALFRGLGGEAALAGQEKGSLITARSLQAFLYRALLDRPQLSLQSLVRGPDFVIGVQKPDAARADQKGPAITVVEPQLPAQGPLVTTAREVRLVIDAVDESGVVEVRVEKTEASLLPDKTGARSSTPSERGSASSSRWGAQVPIAAGENDVGVLATDRAGNQSSLVIRIRRDAPPIPPLSGRAGKDHALLIAITDYENWKTLPNPVLDAKTIKVNLETLYEFQVELVENPTRRALFEKINEYANKNYTEDAQLFIFVAGHGYYNPSQRAAYLVTKEGRRKEDDPFGESFLPHSQFVGFVDNIPCKHILVVLDVCHGGLFFRQRKHNVVRGDVYADRPLPEIIATKLESRTRKWITAGGDGYVFEGQKGEHSPFARRVIEALKSLESSKDVLLSYDDMYRFVEKAKPGPEHGEFGDDQPGSDFLFIRRIFAE